MLENIICFELLVERGNVYSFFFVIFGSVDLEFDFFVRGIVI